MDEFLAPDAPAESRSQPNIYLLHSVLVHSVRYVLRGYVQLNKMYLAYSERQYLLSLGFASVTDTIYFHTLPFVSQSCSVLIL